MTNRTSSFVVAHRLTAEHRRAAALTTRVVAVACLLLGIPFGPGFGWRLFLGVALGLSRITAYAVILLRTTDPA